MKEQEAVDMLIEKYKKLERLPKKSDFEPIEISKIKAKLGPWNRALEVAGLKEISPLYSQKQENKKRKKQNKI